MPFNRATRAPPCRDAEIGLSERAHLTCVVRNDRFLLLPGMPARTCDEERCRVSAGNLPHHFAAPISVADAIHRARTQFPSLP